MIVGMDTELDTTPRRLGMDWAVRMEKPSFIGRASLERTAKLADDAALVRVRDGRGGAAGGLADLVATARSSATSRAPGRRRCSARRSSSAGRSGAPFPDEVEIDGREAVVTPDAVLRPGGPPCPRLSRSPGCASSATPAALDGARWSATASHVLRIAPDEVLAIGATGVEIDDPDAIVEPEPGFVGARLDAAEPRGGPRPRRVPRPDRAPGPRPGQGRRRPGQAAAR